MLLLANSKYLASNFKCRNGSEGLLKTII